MRHLVAAGSLTLLCACGGEDQTTTGERQENSALAICAAHDKDMRPAIVENIHGVSAAIPEGAVVGLSFTGELSACGLPVLFTGFRFGERVMGEKFPVLAVVSVFSLPGCDECVIRSFVEDWVNHGDYQSYDFPIDLIIEPHQTVRVWIYAGYFGRSYRGRAIFDLTPMCRGCDIINRNGGAATVSAIVTVL